MPKRHPLSPHRGSVGRGSTYAPHRHTNALAEALETSEEPLHRSEATHPPGRAPSGAVTLTLSLLALVAGAVTVVGSDALWLSAMGDRIRQAGSIPRGLPFAAAGSEDWVNTTVLGQVLFSWVHQAGSIGIVLTDVLAVVIALAILGVGATRRGAQPLTTSVVLAVAVMGGSTSFFIARAQLLSFVPFALLLVLIRRQQEKPSQAIWWSTPLVALWSNLHGAVLVGVTVLGSYLLLSRLRQTPLIAVAVGVSALLATCLNPGLSAAPRYYMSVLTGEATSNQGGMWGPLSVNNPFDVLLVLAALALSVPTLRRRRPVWEHVAGLGLCLATALAARNGVWLLLFLIVPAAEELSVARQRASSPARGGHASRVAYVLAGVSLVCGAGVLALRDAGFQAMDAQAKKIAHATKGRVVLAPEPLSETLAAAGSTVWASNPLDAFSSSDQSAYLAFLEGDASRASAALERSNVVVAVRGSAPMRAALAYGYKERGEVGTYILMRLK